MKTALQTLIEWLEGFESGPIRPTILRIKEKATELLEAEKQQIIDAHIAGQKYVCDGDNPASEEYYNQKFKP